MSDSFNPYHKWLGIPLREQPANLYRLLGIELLESDADVIENAADQRMRHVRSFQTGPHKALSQALLNEIAAARVRLLDPVQKKAYDATLAAPATAPPTQNVPPKPVPVAPAPPAPLPIQSAPIQPAPIARVQPVVTPTAVTSAPTAPTIRTPSRAAVKRPAQSNAYQFIIVTALVAAGVVLAGVVLASLAGNNDTKQAQSPPVKANPPAPDQSAAKNTTTKQATSPVVKPPVVKPPVVKPPVVKPPVVQPTGTPASPSKLPPLAGATTHQPFTWKRGDKPVELGLSRDHFVVTSWFSGHLLGNGEWYDVDEQKGVNWLRGGGVQDVGATVTQVQSPYRAWFEDHVELVRWKKGQPPIKLIHERDGFAVLCGASGCFLGPEHRIEVKLDRTDGNWYLSGATNFDTKGNALVYRFKEPGKLRAEVEELPWEGTHWEKKMISVDEGLCAISSISGAYRGWGENLNCAVKDDGHWHVCGNTKTNTTAGAFTSIRLKTPAMLALPTNPAAANVGILKVLSGHTAAAISADSRLLATADKEGVLHLWSLPDSREIREMKGHQGNVVSLIFSPDAGQLYSLGKDQTARIWNTATGTETRSFPIGQKPDRSHLTADRKKWFVLKGSAAFAYDVDSGKPLKEWQTAGDGGVSISRLSADGRYAITTSFTNTSKVCDLENGKEMKLEHRAHVYSSALAPDGTVAVTGGGEGIVRVWDVANQKPLAEYKASEHIYAVGISRDQKRVMCVNSSGRLYLWDAMAERPQIFPCPFIANNCGFSSDGRYAFGFSEHGAFLVGLPE